MSSLSLNESGSGCRTGGFTSTFGFGGIWSIWGGGSGNMNDAAGPKSCFTF